MYRYTSIVFSSDTYTKVQGAVIVSLELASELIWALVSLFKIPDKGVYVMCKGLSGELSCTWTGLICHICKG